MIIRRKIPTNSEVTLFWKYMRAKQIPSNKKHMQIVSDCVDHAIADNIHQKNESAIQSLIKFKTLLWSGFSK